VVNKYASISLYKRYDSNGKFIHPGGVEKWAFLLQMAIPELQIFSTDDAPPLGPKSNADWDVAEAMNAWLLASGAIGKDTTVIADGWWYAGLVGKVKRIITVVHGSYMGTLLEHEKHLWNAEPNLGEMALKQEEFYKMPGVEVVSVSQRAADEVKLLCGVDSVVIPNCIPLDIYKPDPGRREDDLILHVSSAGRKNLEMIDQLLGLNKFRIQKLGYATSGLLEEEARLWQRGSIAYFPSFYEGGQYCVVEALACGLVPVMYATGYGFDLSCNEAFVTDDNHVANWAHLLEQALAFKNTLYPREYAEEHFRFEIFADGWKKLLGIN